MANAAILVPAPLDHRAALLPARGAHRKHLTRIAGDTDADTGRPDVSL